MASRVYVAGTGMIEHVRAFSAFPLPRWPGNAVAIGCCRSLEGVRCLLEATLWLCMYNFRVSQASLCMRDLL